MGDVAGVADIVGMSGGVGVVDGETVGDLADGVGLSLTLAVVVASVSTEVSTVADGAISSNMTVSVVGSSDDSTVSEAVGDLADGVGLGLSLTLAVVVTAVAMGDVAGVADVVGMSGDVGVVNWETVGDLADGVGLGLGLTLAVVSAEVSTVANSTVTSNMTVSVVGSSDDSTSGEAVGDLADGVGLTVRHH